MNTQETKSLIEENTGIVFEGEIGISRDFFDFVIIVLTVTQFITMDYPEQSPHEKNALLNSQFYLIHFEVSLFLEKKLGK